VKRSCNDGSVSPSSLLFSSLSSLIKEDIDWKELKEHKPFAESWDRWVKHRSEKGAPLKPTMVQSQIKKLAKIGPVRAVAMIEHTIFKGWQGLREEESNGTNHKANSNQGPGQVHDPNAAEKDPEHGKWY
jgi:hypothetical protein